MSRISPMVLVLSAVVWWILAAPEAAAPAAALVAVAAGGLLHLGLGGRSGSRVSLPGLVAFLPFFAVESVKGGFDVARRAFSPALPLSPGFLEHVIRLPPGSARTFFVNAISLLPGTLSAQLEGSRLTVHLLSTDPEAPQRLQRLEMRVAHLFGGTPGASPGGERP